MYNILKCYYILWQYRIMYMCMLSLFSRVWLFVTLQTVALPGPSVHGILQARILEWIAMPFPRGSSQPRDWTHVSYISCIGKQVLYHLCHLGSPRMHGTWDLMKAQENAFTIVTTSIMKIKWDKLGYSWYVCIYLLLALSYFKAHIRHKAFYFLLRNSWFSRFCQSLLYSKRTQLYIYRHSVWYKVF